MTDRPADGALPGATSDVSDEDAANFVTANAYWRERGDRPARAIGWRTAFLRRLFPKAKTVFEKTLGVKIVSADALRDRAFNSFQTDRQILAYRNAKLTHVLAKFLESCQLDASLERIDAIIREYDEAFFSWPHQDLVGGLGYNNGLFLFAFVRVVDPEIVIESGCWRGFTTYLLDAASGPDARIYCFDINLSLLAYRSPKAEYHEYDIERHPLSVAGKRTVAFFDDHVSHLKRLRHAERLGIDFAVFDDDVTYLSLHSDGWPPLPTISMLFDHDFHATRFEWVNSGRKLEGNYDSLDKHGVLPDEYARYTQDELFEITGYRNSSRTTYLVRRS